MTDCKEYIREVMAITAIPIGNIDASNEGAIVNVLEPTVSATAVVAKGIAEDIIAAPVAYGLSGTYMLVQNPVGVIRYDTNGYTNVTVNQGDIYYVKSRQGYYRLNGTSWETYSAASTIGYDNAITIGLQPIASGVKLIPIKRDTGKAKDDPSDSVAGRGRTVTVNCEVDERGGELWANQLTLERTAHHLILTFRDGDKGFVAATEDTYICNVSRDGAKVNVSFRIHNLMGIQILTT